MQLQPYRRIQSVVHVHQFLGDVREVAWLEEISQGKVKGNFSGTYFLGTLTIHTPEGQRTASFKDWIGRTGDGDWLIYSDEAFTHNYRPLEN